MINQKEWTKEEMKSYFLFMKPEYTLLHNEKTGISLIAEMDLFNNHIEFLVSTENLIHHTTFDVFEAIDVFYKMIHPE